MAKPTYEVQAIRAESGTEEDPIVVERPSGLSTVMRSMQEGDQLIITRLADRADNEEWL